LWESKEKYITSYIKKNQTRSGPDLSKLNTAFVVLDAKTAQILAMVGSRDYNDTTIDGNFNVATALRQPGATDHPDRYILVPVGDVHKATIRTLADAAGKGNVLGVYIEIDPSQTSRVKERWAQYVGTNIPLIVVQEEYRDVSGAMIRYIMEFKGGLVGNQNVSVHITRLTTWNPFWLFLWRFLHNNGTKELEYDLRQNGITYTTLPYRV
jgi:hypothetical protein